MRPTNQTNYRLLYSFKNSQVWTSHLSVFLQRDACYVMQRHCSHQWLTTHWMSVGQGEYFFALFIITEQECCGKKHPFTERIEQHWWATSNIFTCQPSNLSINYLEPQTLPFSNCSRLSLHFSLDYRLLYYFMFGLGGRSPFLQLPTVAFCKNTFFFHHYLQNKMFTSS